MSPDPQRSVELNSREFNMLQRAEMDASYEVHEVLATRPDRGRLLNQVVALARAEGREATVADARLIMDLTPLPMTTLGLSGPRVPSTDVLGSLRNDFLQVDDAVRAVLPEDDGLAPFEENVVRQRVYARQTTPERGRAPARVARCVMTVVDGGHRHLSASSPTESMRFTARVGATLVTMEFNNLPQGDDPASVAVRDLCKEIADVAEQGADVSSHLEQINAILDEADPERRSPEFRAQVSERVCQIMEEAAAVVQGADDVGNREAWRDAYQSGFWYTGDWQPVLSGSECHKCGASATWEHQFWVMDRSMMFSVCDPCRQSMEREEVRMKDFAVPEDINEAEWVCRWSVVMPVLPRAALERWE